MQGQTAFMHFLTFLQQVTMRYALESKFGTRLRAMLKKWLVNNRVDGPARKWILEKNFKANSTVKSSIVVDAMKDLLTAKNQKGIRIENSRFFNTIGKSIKHESFKPSMKISVSTDSGTGFWWICKGLRRISSWDETSVQVYTIGQNKVQFKKYILELHV